MRSLLGMDVSAIVLVGLPECDRFRGGHKALLWAFIEELKATDIRIAFYQLDFTQWIRLSSELESLIIQAINPPYNVKIPARD